MRVRKADSKGRISGVRAGEDYYTYADSSGKITLTPVRPREVDRETEIDLDTFQKAFGFHPRQVAEGGVSTYRISPGNESPDYFPVGILVQTFALDELGLKVMQPGGAVRENTLIKVKKK